MKKENEKRFLRNILFWVIAISVGVSLNFGFVISMMNMGFKNILNEELLLKSFVC